MIVFPRGDIESLDTSFAPSFRVGYEHVEGNFGIEGEREGRCLAHYATDDAAGALSRRRARIASAIAESLRQTLKEVAGKRVEHVEARGDRGRRMRRAFVDALIEVAERDPSVWLLTGDLGYTVLEPFRERMAVTLGLTHCLEELLSSFTSRCVSRLWSIWQPNRSQCRS